MSANSALKPQLTQNARKQLNGVYLYHTIARYLQYTNSLMFHQPYAFSDFIQTTQCLKNDANVQLREVE